MRAKKKTNEELAEQKERDIRFVQRVASDYDLDITRDEAKKCLDSCGDDYYAMKEYFLN